jgi:hypothetical protein
MDSIVALTLVLYAVLIAGCVFILPKRVAARVTYATKHEYDELIESIKLSHQRILEQEKNSNAIRLKAAMISELMAEWVTQSKDRKRLRELTFEAFFWLPEDLAIDLSKILSHKPDAIDFRDFMLKVRRYLGVNDNLESWRIITFPLSDSEK